MLSLLIYAGYDNSETAETKHNSLTQFFLMQCCYLHDPHESSKTTFNCYYFIFLLTNEYIDCKI